jgi:DNA-binding SARP family transcriptional activator
LHGLFLETTEATASALMSAQRYKTAIDVLERAIAVDATTLDLEAALVRALHRSGAIAAAAHQYKHYAAAFRAEFGSDPPEFDLLVAVAEHVSQPGSRRSTADR